MQTPEKAAAAIILGKDELSRSLFTRLRSERPWGAFANIASRTDYNPHDFFGPNFDAEDLVKEQACWPSLQGPHNLENAVAAMLAGSGLCLDNLAIDNGLRTFPGLPHRMERIRDLGGVAFVNDSKATNPASTAPALAAFPAIRWICGGQAKTDNLDECAASFGHVRAAYTIGEAGELFASLLGPHMPVTTCETLENAVERAARDSQPGETVLLSPACASFDQFRDFEQRGDRFRELVEAL